MKEDKITLSLTESEARLVMNATLAAGFDQKALTDTGTGFVEFEPHKRFYEALVAVAHKIDGQINLQVDDGEEGDYEEEEAD